MYASRRNTIIVLATNLGLGLAEGYALAAACTWVISAASLGAFLTFCVWLLAGIVLALSAEPLSKAISRVLSDERIDNTFASAKSFFSRFTTKAA